MNNIIEKSFKREKLFSQNKYRGLETCNEFGYLKDKIPILVSSPSHSHSFKKWTNKKRRGI